MQNTVFPRLEAAVCCIEMYCDVVPNKHGQNTVTYIYFMAIEVHYILTDPVPELDQKGCQYPNSAVA